MGQPFVGEIRCFGFNFQPAGWAWCNGQLLPISEYETLYNLIGTTYGGDGVNTFQLPNLQSRVPIHQGNLGGTNYLVGATGGVETVTLTIAELTAHNHVVVGTSLAATLKRPANTFYAASSSGNEFYAAGTNTLTALTASTVSSQGGSQPHDNIQPFLTLNWCISLFGIYPTPS
jgi:microcystin-dependent protein